MKDLLNKFCLEYKLKPVALQLVTSLPDDDLGLYIRETNYSRSKILLSMAGNDIDTLLHELTHHYQFSKFVPKSHHDYTFQNSLKVVLRWYRKLS